jgi:hypothetical protein
VDPRRIDPATRIMLALLSKLFNWRDALVVVQPKTLIRWHRAGFRLLRHWKSKPGRPPVPAELRRLIREMSHDNLLWGEERMRTNCRSSSALESRRARCASTCAGVRVTVKRNREAWRDTAQFQSSPICSVCPVRPISAFSLPGAAGKAKARRDADRPWR